MTTGLLFWLGAIFFICLVLHFVRGRRSDLWQGTVPRSTANKTTEGWQSSRETEPTRSDSSREEDDEYPKAA